VSAILPPAFLVKQIHRHTAYSNLLAFFKDEVDVEGQPSSGWYLAVPHLASLVYLFLLGSELTVTVEHHPLVEPNIVREINFVFSQGTFSQFLSTVEEHAFHLNPRRSQFTFQEGCHYILVGLNGLLASCEVTEGRLGVFNVFPHKVKFRLSISFMFERLLLLQFRVHLKFLRFKVMLGVSAHQVLLFLL
jgi:hypothetical protein